MVSIPVRLTRAARAERVNLRELYRAAPREPELEPAPETPANVIELRRGGPFRQAAPAVEPSASITGEPEAEYVEPVRHAAVRARGEQPIPADRIVKGYEVAPRQFVLLEREELKGLRRQTSSTIEIQEFVPFAAIDPLYFETSYYVAPGPAGEKPYSLLFDALQETAQAGVASLAMHGREHVLIVRAGRKGLIAHTMYYEDEIRRNDEYAAIPGLASSRERELARLFVSSLSSEFDPSKYKDAYRGRLEAMIAAKAAGRQLMEPAPLAPQRPQPPDLIAALEKSLAAIRKPPAAEKTAAKRPAKARRTRSAG
jgi:DNA end-binding protein Ku